MFKFQYKWACLVLVLAVVLAFLLLPAVSGQAQDTRPRGLQVTLLVFSGRPNPVYWIRDAGVISQLRGRMGKAAVSAVAADEVMPARLGYSGIVVENVGRVAGFPRSVAVYKQNLLIEGRPHADDGSLEKLLLGQAALDKNLAPVLAFIESDKDR